MQFGVRIVMGALSGAASGASSGMLVVCGFAGIAGAVIGTLGGSAIRAKLAVAFGSDTPAALIEDAVAILAAIAIVRAIA